MSKNFEPIKVVEATETNSGAVIFLHGCGGTGNELLNTIFSLLGDDFALPNVKFIFPTAAVRPLTANLGEVKNAWFDIVDLTFTSVEHEESIRQTCEHIKALVEEIVSSGIPPHKIVLGGFSMGGALALHTVYRFLPNLGGVFVLSSFISENSVVYDVLKEKPSSVPLFMCQGDEDVCIPLPWAQKTFDKCIELKISGKFHIIPNLVHTLEENELRMLLDWIGDIIKV